MKKTAEKIKEGRAIKSFEADSDVVDMLENAKRRGLTMGEILNRSVRKYGPKVIQEITKERQDLLASFNCAYTQQCELRLAA